MITSAARLGPVAGSARERSAKVLAMEEEVRSSRRMLSMEQVLQIVPVGRNTLMRMIERKEFPHGRYISPNKRVWYDDEVQSWQDNLPQNSGRKPRKTKAADH